LLLRERERRPLDANLPWALRWRVLDERLLRAMINSGYEWLYLHAGCTSASNELPNEGNKGDHEQEVNQPAADVEDDKAE
jgi:hypothetical protein